MASQWELIAGRRSVAEIRDHIGADSLGYLSMNGLMRAVQQDSDSFCTACFTGDYPMPVQLQMSKLVFEDESGVEGQEEAPLSSRSWERDRV